MRCCLLAGVSAAGVPAYVRVPMLNRLHPRCIPYHNALYAMALCALYGVPVRITTGRLRRTVVLHVQRHKWRVPVNRGVCSSVVENAALYGAGTAAAGAPEHDVENATNGVFAFARHAPGFPWGDNDCASTTPLALALLVVRRALRGAARETPQDTARRCAPLLSALSSDMLGTVMCALADTVRNMAPLREQLRTQLLRPLLQRRWPWPEWQAQAHPATQELMLECVEELAPRMALAYFLRGSLSEDDAARARRYKYACRSRRVYAGVCVECRRHRKDMLALLERWLRDSTTANLLHTDLVAAAAEAGSPAPTAPPAEVPCALADARSKALREEA